MSELFLINQQQFTGVKLKFEAIVIDSFHMFDWINKSTHHVPGV